MLDGRYQCRYVTMLREKDGIEWATKPLRMWYAFRVEGKRISQALANKLSKIFNISAVIERLEATHKDSMEILLIYARSFDEDYGVRFVDAGIKEIMEAMISSKALDGYSRAMHVRNIRFSKIIIKYEAVVLLLGKLGKVALGANTLGITHFHDLRLYISSEVDKLLIVQDAHAFVKNDHKPAFFHANLFYRHTKALPDELHLHHLRQNKEKFRTTILFLGTNSQPTEIISIQSCPSTVATCVRLTTTHDINRRSGRQSLRCRGTVSCRKLRHI